MEFEALADYDFSKANTVVSMDADFLGDWQGGGYAKGYAQAKTVLQNITGKPKCLGTMQFESNMTLTGANADHRIPCTPADQKQILAHIVCIS